MTKSTLEMSHQEIDRVGVVELVESKKLSQVEGITIRKTNDVIIATFYIESNLPLLFSDHDFIPFVDHLGLIPASSKT